MPGAGGGQPGDLFMKIHVGARPGFERKGADLYTTVQIPFATAALGGEVMVETLTGRVLCKIRKGTQSGSKIRLRGKGVARMNQPSVHGDQYVTVQIQVPDTLTPEAEQKLREFAAACQKVVKEVIRRHKPSSTNTVNNKNSSLSCLQEKMEDLILNE